MHNSFRSKFNCNREGFGRGREANMALSDNRDDVDTKIVMGQGMDK